MKINPPGCRVGRPHVIEVAVSLRDMLHQGDVLHLPLRVGRQIADLPGTAYVQSALIVFCNGAHDGLVDRFDQPP